MRNLVVPMLLGFCVIASAAKGDEIKIVALGDSLIQGYGLPPEAGFVPRMQEWLDAKGEQVSLVNAGVSGDTTTGGLARLDWALAPDSDALIVSLGANDILRAIEPPLARANLTAILNTAQERGLPVLLIGINVPPNYGVEYQEQFSAIFPELSHEFGTIFVADFLGPLMAEGDMATNLARYFQADGLHPNPTGLSLIIEDIGPAIVELAQKARAD